MPLFEVKAGGPDIPDGVYPVTLVDITGPKVITAQKGPNAGEEFSIFEWLFAVDDGPYENTEIPDSTSTSSGPKSKLYGWVTALLNGVPPAVGTKFEVTDLKGRRAFATIRRENAGDWPKISNLGAMPVSNQQQGFAKATGAAVAPERAPAPAAASAAPLREAVAAGAGPDAPADNLPF
jgi:hypothetical protein